MTGLVECVAVPSQTKTMTEDIADILYSAEFTICSELFPVTLHFDEINQPGKVRVILTQTGPGPGGCNLGFDSGWQTPTAPLPNLVFVTSPTFCRNCPCCTGFGIQNGWQISINQLS